MCKGCHGSEEGDKVEKKTAGQEKKSQNCKCGGCDKCPHCECDDCPLVQKAE